MGNGFPAGLSLFWASDDYVCPVSEGVLGMGSDRHAVRLVSAEVREQVERAMADPSRVMPKERAMLEKAGFVARRTMSCPRAGAGPMRPDCHFPG